MSTINPDLIDVTKPETGEATTASVRANEQATKTNLQAAKTDIEALETGKADQSALDAHVGTGGAAQHPVTVVGTPGFAPALSGNAGEYLDGSGAFSTPAGGSGTYNQASKDGTVESSNRAILEFRDTGDATVNVTDDPGGDRTIITIDASAGAGGGGIEKGAPFVSGDLLLVQDAADPGQAQTLAAGLSGAEVRAHLDDATIHFTVASIDHGSIAGLADDDHPQYHNDTRGDARYYPRTEADSVFMKTLADDPSPNLAGDLRTIGNSILVTDNGGAIKGAIAQLGGRDGAALIYSDDAGPVAGDGAVSVEPGIVGLWGSAIYAQALEHTETGGRQVYVSDEGYLYGVNPPTPGWTISDTDAADYDLGSGTGTGAWENLLGLTVSSPLDVEIGQRLDYSITLYVSNTSNQSGTIDVGFSVNDPAGPPVLGASISVSAGFVGIAPVAFSAQAAQAYAAGADVDVWARRNNGSGPQYAPDLLGTVTPHEFVLSTPGEGGGTGPQPQTVNHTWSVDGAPKVKAYPPMIALVQGGETAQLLRVATKLATGTATIQLLKNGTPIADSTRAVTTTKDVHTLAAAESIADGDDIAMEVTAQSGTDLSVTILMERTR